MSLNREWHADHVLGKGAPLEARIAWHVEHARVCGCRGMPASIERELARRAAERTPTDADDR